MRIVLVLKAIMMCALFVMSSLVAYSIPAIELETSSESLDSQEAEVQTSSTRSTSNPRDSVVHHASTSKLETDSAPTGNFTFGAVGDMGWNSNTDATRAALHTLNPDFFLTVGDLGYTSNASGWCDYITDPDQGEPKLVWVTGNHETSESGPGRLLEPAGYIASCPFSLGVALTGLYGIEYYFDYPAANPLARFILHSDGIHGEVHYDYSLGTVHYNFVRDAINGARAAGIPWVIVGSHKGCVYTGDYYSCHWNSDLWSLMFEKRVDLVLYGHAHTYARSHQVTCAPPGTTVQACVVDADSTFSKGAGTVIVLAGTGGRSLRESNPNDPEAGYFARLMNSDYGFVKYTISTDRIDAAFVSATGSFTDAWAISETVHDISVRAVTETVTVVARDYVYNQVPTGPVIVKVTVHNEGTFTETFTVTLRTGGVTVGTQTVTDMALGTFQEVAFDWNAHTSPIGSYLLIADLSAVAEEADLADNSLTGGTIAVRLRGDVTNDCSVNIVDLAKVGAAFGKAYGSTGYDGAEDLDNNATVDVLDLASVGISFGSTC